MSFENKGFPNNLNKQYDNLRARALNYDDNENYGGLSAFELSAIANIVKKNNQLKTIDTESKGIVKGGGLSTKTNPAELPDFVIEAPKKPKAIKMKYFYYIIAIILIILIYKQFKK